MLFAIVILGALVALLLYVLFRVTRKVEIKSTSIVNRIEKIPELSTAKLTITQIYEMERKSVVPGLSGKYTLIVPITVPGFLDLSTLKEENIEVLETDDAKRVTLRLPLPNLEITVTLSQLNEIKVINESGMLVKMFGPKDKLRILKENTNAIREKAIKESEKTGVIDIAKESARNFFHGLVTWDGV